MPRTEPYGVVRDIGIGFLGTEIQYVKAHRILRKAVWAPNSLPFQMRGQQGFVGMWRIAIEYDVIGGQVFPRCEHNPRGHPVFDGDLVNIGASSNRDLLFLHQLRECIHQRSGTPHTEVDTPLTLKVMNEGVDRCCGVRVATDQQWVN